MRTTAPSAPTSCGHPDIFDPADQQRTYGHADIRTSGRSGSRELAVCPIPADTATYGDPDILGLADLTTYGHPDIFDPADQQRTYGHPDTLGLADLTT